jgi:hypothetical protein
MEPAPLERRSVSDESDLDIDAMMRVRAWYAIFRVTRMASNQASLEEIRNGLIQAIQRVDEAMKQR